jgi:hypothetical protein
MSAHFRHWLETAKRYPYTILFVLFALAMAVPFLHRSDSDSDWQTVYLSAAHRLQAGEDLFQVGYLYPPASAWLALPFASLPAIPGKLAWYGINVLALAIVLRGVWRLTGGGRLEGVAAIPASERLIVILGLLASVYFVFDALSNQQTDLVLAALIIGGCLLLVNGRQLAAGLLIGVAAGMKCTPLLWAPYLAWRGHWRAATMAVVVAVGINLLPDVTDPPPGEPRLKQWASRFLAPMTAAGHTPGTWGSAINFNHSVAGVMNRWLTFERIPDGDDLRPVERSDRASAGVVKIVVASTDLLLIVMAVALTWRQRSAAPDAREFSMVLLLMLLLSPMSSKPHFCTLLLPAFYMARVAVQRRELLPCVLLGISIVAGLASNKDLVRRFMYDGAIWYGSVFWMAVSLFVGCCIAVPKKDIGGPDLGHLLPKRQSAPIRCPVRLSAVGVSPPTGIVSGEDQVRG